MRIPLAYKFILGFIAVVATAGFVPFIIARTEVPEEFRNPVSLGIAMLIGLILGSIFSRSFTKRFTFFTKAATKMGLGDLSFSEKEHAPRLLFKDETNDLEEALSLLFSNLRGLILHLKETATKLAEAQAALSTLLAEGKDTNTEVISSSSKIFEGALEQARHADSTAAMIKDVAAFAEEVSTKVADTLTASRQAHTMVEKGSTVSNAAIEKLEDIFEGLYKTESAATHLKERINDIPRVLDVITHISRQTDLLALNATIEASKAGEHGKGFALVAEEVRRFAESTNRSVEDVSVIVRELKNEVERVVANVANSSTYIKDGRDDIRKIRDIFSEIENYTSDVSAKADLIIDLTDKQRTKAAHTVTIIDELAGIAQSNLTTTEVLDQSIDKHGAAIDATFDALTKLATLSKELENATSRFVVEQGFEEQAAMAVEEVSTPAYETENLADSSSDSIKASVEEAPFPGEAGEAYDDTPTYEIKDESETDESPLIPTPDLDAPAPAEEAADTWLGETAESAPASRPAATAAADDDLELPPAPWETPAAKKEMSIEDLTKEDKDA